MNLNLTLKLGAIALLILLLLIPLMMINGVIQDRQQLRDGVLEDIARSSSLSQQLSGPLMVVPYRKVVRTWKFNDKTNERYQEVGEERGRLYFLPERFELDGQVQAERRSRGIYEARLFHADNRISGHFSIPEQLGIREDFADYQFDPPFLAVGISDIRGIENALKLELDGQQLDFVPGSKVGFLGEGVHVNLPALDAKNVTELAFGFDLRLQGTGQLQVLPVGKTSKVSLAANWPHPSFIGNYLPAQREVTDQGFTAYWQTSFFSTNLQEVLNTCVSGAGCEVFRGRSFGVSFIDPVDQYLKTDRAIKYALLFIVLTFAGFFLFEVMKSLAVHPVQYGLVGVALAFFYLLLLSLSEHIGFARAYLLSASGCVLLIGFYVCHVLRSVRHGLSFSAGLAVLYGLLYGVLSAEDYALLMGSLLLFGLLGVFMVLTRKLDWYGVGQKATRPLAFDIGAVA
ncbi:MULTISPECIES: cell envelope integrity protein CreD [unclassified Pseudomonas]|uniref:cell envelope integrity protein CreD n=1 Tax=unclassified Pseudomonas TaxID=196821 RepID=UPI002AC9DFC2|nr:MULTISPECIES: cell envelope integrity protein CreD [unclassified Pseudomonas]MEB0048607.1 cell envelope integrity protein CreD [Pseudomonas sp. Dout3]MEB0099494.1 cell envelope integrity protein CreD [Pseudomonas sp. DC1.2]WPX58478.1 cell envelope integrity protein CreD [Pseudomonas sp. DC1.2]